MLRTIFLTALVLVTAIAGGAASVWYALGSQEGIGAVSIGPWTAFPELGTPQADPYSKARIAREGVLSLGLAEGLAFVAQHDSDGAALNRKCAYSIQGAFPPARFWTLYAADNTRAVIHTEHLRPPALHSVAALRDAANAVTIAVGRQAVPGNWIPISGSGPMNLVLTLYDAPATSSSGIADIALPEIRKTGCDG
jgi:hypothetical protein